MSHIPASAMPHAHANGDAIDDQPPQADQRQPEAEPTTATPDQSAPAAGDATAPAPLATSATQRAQGEAPLQSAAPATSTGNRAGGGADRISDAAGEPDATATRTGQAPVQGDEREQIGGRLRSAATSRAGIAALSVAGVAAIAGIVAAALPLLRHQPQPKSKKRKRKSA